MHQVTFLLLKTCWMSPWPEEYFIQIILIFSRLFFIIVTISILKYFILKTNKAHTQRNIRTSKPGGILWLSFFLDVRKKPLKALRHCHELS